MSKAQFDPGNSRTTRGYIHDTDKKAYKLFGPGNTLVEILATISLLTDTAYYLRIQTRALDYMSKMAAEFHVLVTWTIGNLSYETARTLRHHRHWIWYLWYKRIPEVSYAAAQKAANYVRVEAQRFAYNSAMYAYGLSQKYANSLFLYNAKAISALTTYVKQRFLKQQHQIDAIIPNISKQIVTACQTPTSQAESDITRIFDIIVAHDPLVKDAIKLLTKAVVDFLEVDNPVTSLAVKVALGEVVKHFGIDSAISGFVSSITNGIVQHHSAKGIHDTIATMCNRIDGLEGNWTNYFKNGGASAEQRNANMSAVAVAADMALLSGMISFVNHDPNAFVNAWQSTVGEAVKPIARSATAAASIDPGLALATIVTEGLLADAAISEIIKRVT